MQDPQRALDRLFGLHALIAALWVSWRVLESTPATAPSLGGAFASSTVGRALALVTLSAAAAASVAVLALSLSRWREWRASLLLVVLAGALSTRTRVDVFDLVYVGLVAMIVVPWFDARWRRGRRAAGPQAS